MNNNIFRKGQECHVYHGDHLGWIWATLIEKVGIDENGIENWTMLTDTGEKIVRPVEKAKVGLKNGSAYPVEYLDEWGEPENIEGQAQYL